MNDFYQMVEGLDSRTPLSHYIRTRKAPPKEVKTMTEDERKIRVDWQEHVEQVRAAELGLEPLV